MARPSSFSSCMVIFTLAFLAIFTSHSSAQLSTNFYSKSCPKVFGAVKSVVQSAVSKERRMGASLVRLFFHDCFVKLGGPFWDVKLGRRDSKTASLSAANSGVIPPPTSTLSNLINRFNSKGLSVKDMVALSGSHTIGQARCTSFRARIYNETNIDSSFANTRQKKCPFPGPKGDNNLAPLDVQTPTAFDNNYYKNLISQKGLLHSDQVLFNGGSTDSLVRTYSRNPKTFSSDFVTAMIKMGDIDPLTGSQGEIRKICSKPN
uniref:peroxidase n=1 Tax=Populus alba TaxID=43335 RepID=A0A4U5QF74_POPAL|nr:peroxidase family protein [Populus alba]